MLLPTLLHLSLLSLLPSTLALALPQPSPSSSTTTTPTLVPTGPEYHLRTRLANNSTAATKAQYNDLCLVAYHTGAAENDAVLYPGTEYCIKGFLNATQASGESYQEFDLGNYWPYGLGLAYEPYAAWAPVRINAGQGDVGMVMAPEGLISNATEFGGWMVCDWWHGDVQLFWRNKFEASGSLAVPQSCAEVFLVPTNRTVGGFLNS
ncbi:hypothetical protein K490DRAFT_67362 [Saccharata proteae CBS 121410]|uniref:DUF7907 domain-containing protein n=1 Tax=Saccharata proteae CBS 121410 TaxID=1314787 RepID=A0A9P4HSR4_9PEZI|nr:hypothetical protein K490DRAFT_67362 [Saccharata proteae CBS 121410]